MIIYQNNMRNNLPQLHINLSKELIHIQKEPSQKKMTAHPKINIRGITLREYFRLCDQNKYDQCIKEVQECQKQQQELVQTPSFNNPHTKRQMRIKIKTEISEQNYDSATKGLHSKYNQLDNETTNRSINLNLYQKNHKLNQLRQNHPNKKKESRKKLLVNFHSNKHHKDQINNSMLGYISQMEDNKNKMLKKIENQRERINDLRLSDAFIVTKYGSKFRIQSKEKQYKNE